MFPPVVMTTGSAAEASGLMMGDTLISVNGQDVTSLTHVDLVGSIKQVCHWRVGSCHV